MGQRPTLAKTLEKIARFVQNINYMTPVSNAGVRLPSQPTVPTGQQQPFDYRLEKGSDGGYRITGNTRLNWDAVDFDTFRKAFTQYWNANRFFFDRFSRQGPTLNRWLHNEDFWNAVKASKTYGDLNKVLLGSKPVEREIFRQAVADAHFPDRQYNNTFIHPLLHPRWPNWTPMGVGYQPFSQFYIYNPARHS